MNGNSKSLVHLIIITWQVDRQQFIFRQGSHILITVENLFVTFV